MADTLDDLHGFPDLITWIRARKWEIRFNPRTLQRARAYSREGRVGEMFSAASKQTVHLLAPVAGSDLEPYQTALRFVRNPAGQWRAEGNCTCPVALDCKHAAALLYQLVERLAKPRPAPAAQNELFQVESKPTLRRDVREWLRRLEAAARKPAPSSKPAKPAAQERFLAYCLEPEGPFSDAICLALRVGSPRKTGPPSIADGFANARLDHPPQYLAAADLPILLQLRQLGRYHGPAPVIAGPGWKELLDDALATGRLFWCAAGHGDTPVVVAAGQPEPVEAGWEPDADGTRPVIRIHEGLQLLPTDPPLYFHPQDARLGPLDSPLPGSVLAAWTQGPELFPEEISHVAASLPTLPAALPQPRQLDTVVLPDVAPVPRLYVTRRTYEPEGKTLHITVGMLGFRYGDDPELPPLDPQDEPRHVRTSGERILVRHRDRKAEDRAWDELIHAGLIPLDEILPWWAFDEDEETEATFVPEEPKPSPELAWLRFLDGPDARKMREAGWIIDVAPEAQLEVKDVTDFLPMLDPDDDDEGSGIDWFRFDVGFEIDGRTFSLIPLILDAIEQDFPAADSPDLPEFMFCPAPGDINGLMRLPARRLMEIVEQVRHLFRGRDSAEPPAIDRLAAAGLADDFQLDDSDTTRSLAQLGRSLRDIRGLPAAAVPKSVQAELRPYQLEGYRWLRFLGEHGLHGILADDMGLGKTLQTLTLLAAARRKAKGRPSLVVAPTSVVPNWAAEAARFTPTLKTLVHHGPDRDPAALADAQLVITSYALLHRDREALGEIDWHHLVLDEAQAIKNPKSITAKAARELRAAHRICLSGTPMENHLGELWSLMSFLMPGLLGDEKTFNTTLRRPIEKRQDADAQQALNRRVAPLMLRRTKDEVAAELPKKTEIVHPIDLTRKQADLYESVRAAMDERIRDAIADKGLARSQIIILDALLKLRQICCHPSLLSTPAAKKVTDSAKLAFLTNDLLPTLVEEGRRILLFSQFTSMLALIEAHLQKEGIPFLKLTGATKNRATLVKQFQKGEVPVFLISLKAGGTGLNLTAADTVIHYDPWWNPAAENQATDRAHRIGQDKPVFVHKLICRGTIEDRILELQAKKSGLVEALLSEETRKLRLDSETLKHLLAPL